MKEPRGVRKNVALPGLPGCRSCRILAGRPTRRRWANRRPARGRSDGRRRPWRVGRRRRRTKRPSGRRVRRRTSAPSRPRYRPPRSYRTAKSCSSAAACRINDSMKDMGQIQCNANLVRKGVVEQKCERNVIFLNIRIPCGVFSRLFHCQFNLFFFWRWPNEEKLTLALFRNIFAAEQSRRKTDIKSEMNANSHKFGSHLGL